jgi:hypothetical protein
MFLISPVVDSSSDSTTGWDLPTQQLADSAGGSIRFDEFGE